VLQPEAAAAVAVAVVVAVVVVVEVLDNYRIQFTAFADLRVKFSQLCTVFIAWIKNCLALDLQLFDTYFHVDKYN
jgi:hypothetical protein